MKIKLIVFSVALSLVSSFCKSQDVAIGQWKDYLSYQQGLTVCQGGNKIYCCCSSGVFSYNLSDNSIERYNKVTGLSDIGCKVARYNTATNTLVVGYSNGNIDLVTGNNIVNIPDIKNSSTQGSKTINNIYFYNNLAYVSCGLGIIVIDLSQDIILSNYYIGPFGSSLNVYSTTIYNDTLYAATHTGIYYISIYDPNPSDFQNWKVVQDTILHAGAYNAIVTCGGKMYASFSQRITNSVTGKDIMFVYSSGKWNYFINAAHTDTNLYKSDDLFSVESSSVNNTAYLITCGDYNASVYDQSGNLINKIISYGFTVGSSQNDAIVDNAMNVWIADGNSGLVKSATNNTGQSYFPPGPYSNSIFATATEGPYLYIAPGGYDNSQAPLGIRGIGVSEYYDNSWNRLIEPGAFDSISDLCCVAIDPRNPLHACAGSWSQGVVEYNNNAFTTIYGSYNSALTTLYDPLDPGYYSIRVGGVGFDTLGNLWATNSATYTKFLVAKEPNGTWHSIDFSNLDKPGIEVTKLLITQSGAKWMLCPGQGIIAYQDYGTFAKPDATNSVLINNLVGNGALPSLNIYCMTEDLTGAIWIGSNTQVVVFYSPDNVFNGFGAGWDAQNVYVQQTGYTQYLMQNQYTTAIAVDGANRKWIGTLGGGAFLMSADGTQQILNLTAENSPLLSDNILSISINQANGEVFFGTDKGLVSYRGTATEGGTAFSNVYTYPNPIPHGYSGPIAITNLVTNSDVKIADVKGEIVYHTVAQGGQAIWNGNNFSGQRVQTGVYMVYCTSPDGSQSLVTKLLFVN